MLYVEPEYVEVITSKRLEVTKSWTVMPPMLLAQGLLEQVTTAMVNLVNADLLAKNRGLTIIETTVPAPGKCAGLRDLPLVRTVIRILCSSCTPGSLTKG